MPLTLVNSMVRAKKEAIATEEPIREHRTFGEIDRAWTKAQETTFQCQGVCRRYYKGKNMSETDMGPMCPHCLK